MKHLYLCRHGLSEMNKAGLFSGQTDTPLSAEGRAQARAAGAEARKLGIDHIIVSPFSRTYDTAVIIAKEIGYPLEEIELNVLLIERGLGVLEGTRQTPGIDITGVEGAEPIRALSERMRRFYDYVQTIPKDNILVVTHGSSGRMLRHVVNPDIPFKVTPNSPGIDNANIIQLC